MFSKRVENTVGKGEIARYEQFLLFTMFFKRLILQTRKNRACLGKVKDVLGLISQIFQDFYNSKYLNTTSDLVKNSQTEVVLRKKKKKTTRSWNFLEEYGPLTTLK